MDVPFSGGCACGTIRYQCSSAPLAMLNCHCRDCQQASGAPFASGLMVPTPSLTVTGVPKACVARASSGAETTRSFCPECGSPLFARSGAMPEFTSVRFTTLDAAGDFRPALDIWTASAVPWVCFDPELPRFDHSPHRNGDGHADAQAPA